MSDSPALGWVGSREQLLYALKAFNVDCDEQGRPMVRGHVCSFLGLGDELVVGPEVVCSINGREVSIAGLLGQTSYGSRVQVI